MLLKKQRGAEENKKHEINLVKIGVIAGLTGILTWLFGVGGGFLIVPGLIVFGKLSPKKAVATSLFVIFLISLVALLQKIGSSTIQWNVTLLFLAAMVIGMFIGSALGKKLREESVKKVFALFVLVLGIIQTVVTLF